MLVCLAMMGGTDVRGRARDLDEEGEGAPGCLAGREMICCEKSSVEVKVQHLALSVPDGDHSVLAVLMPGKGLDTSNLIYLN